MLKKINLKFKKDPGVTLLLSILVLASVMAISFSLTTILFIEIRSSSDLLKTESALYGATGVGEQALFNLKRDACPSGGSSCYITGYDNSVSLTGVPQAVNNNNPIFTDKVSANSTFLTTSKRYEFCGSTPVYDGLGQLMGCGYAKVTVNYVPNSVSTYPIKVYLCEWDPNVTYTTNPPCSSIDTSPSAQPYWKAPCSSFCGTADADGGVQIYSGTNNSASWDINPSMQQELIVTNTNPSGTSDVYYSVATYDADGVTPKGLPYVGRTSISIQTQSGQAGRKILVTVPNTSVASTPTSYPPVFINMGGANYTDSLSQTWVNDSGYISGGTFYSTINSITNTSDPTLYQTQKYGNMTVTIGGLTAGSTRNVTLKFAELFFSSANSRTFNVTINGTQVLSNFDVWTDAGARDKADDKTFTTTVNGSGQIVIQFVSVINNAIINAVEIN